MSYQREMGSDLRLSDHLITPVVPISRGELPATDSVGGRRRDRHLQCSAVLLRKLLAKALYREKLRVSVVEHCSQTVSPMPFTQFARSNWTISKPRESSHSVKS